MTPEEREKYPPPKRSDSRYQALWDRWIAEGRHYIIDEDLPGEQWKRKCWKCGKVKLLSEFPQQFRLGGFFKHPKCLGCSNIEAETNKFRITNQERRERLEAPVRECLKCHEIKPKSEFHTGRYKCRKCIYAEQKDRMKREPEYKAKRKESEKQARLNNPRYFFKIPAYFVPSGYFRCAACGRVLEISLKVKKRLRCKSCANKEVRKKEQKRRSKKRDTDPRYRQFEALRRRMQRAVNEQDAVKATKTITLLGCSPSQLQAHLEAKFKPGMSWDNYGKWHVDHIRPCASFDLADPAQQRECFNWQNLQPLWAADNIRKGAKI